jgi:branched-chain amino acid transport system substrate-binding protein
VNNDFGKGGHQVFLDEMKKVSIEVVTDVLSEPGQADFAADVSKLKSTSAQSVFVYLNEEESARFLTEAAEQTLGLPLVGEVTLTGQKVIDPAGAAAERPPHMWV